MKCPKNAQRQKKGHTKDKERSTDRACTTQQRQKTEGRVADKRKRERESKRKDQGLDKHDRRELKTEKAERGKTRMGEDGGEEPCAVHLQSG